MKQKTTRASRSTAQQNGAAATPAKPAEVAAPAAEATPVKAAGPAAKKNQKKVVEAVAPVVATPVVEAEIKEEEEVDIKEECMEEDYAEDAGGEEEEEMVEGEETGDANEANQSKTSGGQRIKNGPVAKEIPDEQVIVVKNLPRKLKQAKIVEVFAKYGTITTIHIIPTPDQESSTAYVAFEQAEQATAALEANSSAQIGGKPLQIMMRKTSPKKQKKFEDRQKQLEEKQKIYEERKKLIEDTKDRTVYVRNLKAGTTEEQLREHFTGCGEITNITLVTRRSHYAFVSFAEVESTKAALKLHSSVLNGLSIGVFMRGDENDNTFVKDPARTVLVKNVQNLETVDVEKLNTIFGACGELETIEILCKRVVLAFVTFKTEEGAQKALELSGTTAEELELEIEAYKLTNKMRNTVFIQNVKSSVVEDQLRDLFSEAGAVENVIIKPGYALVRFADTDGFCKAFLLNESVLAGQMIFLEPYSERKQTVLKSRKPHHHAYHHHHGGKKRTMSMGYGQNRGTNPKKFKQI